MKFEATAGVLSTALDAAALALDDRSNVKALSMVRIVAQDNVTFIVDSLDRRVRVNVAAIIIEPGEAAARCTALTGILGGLNPDRDVAIETRGDGVTVRSGKSRFAIAGLPIGMLPQSGELIDPAASFDLDVDELQRMIEVCEHAISTEETRYYLNGIYLHTVGTAKAPMLRAVATDGHRLAQFELPLPASAEGMPGIIIPGKVIAIIAKLLKRKPVPETVSLRLSDKLLEVSLPNLSLTAKLIDGTFPNYGCVVPPASSNAAIVDTDNLRQALARIEALFDEKSKRGMRTVGLSWSNGTLHVSLTSDNETDDIIDDIKTTGDGRFAARISYLTDVLEAFGSKKIMLDTNGPKSPAIRVTDPDDAAPFAVVMPIRGAP